MSELRKCFKCGKKYDPSTDFVESENANRVIDYFLEYEFCCSACSYDLYEKIIEVWQNWRN